MRWVIILLSSCGAQQLYTLLQRRKVVKRAHGRRTIGDGGGVGETETVRRDRDRASEKYLVVPLMETVPIYMCVTTAAAATAAAVRVVFVNRFVQYYYNTDLRCMCVCVSVYSEREVYLPCACVQCAPIVVREEGKRSREKDRWRMGRARACIYA